VFDDFTLGLYSFFHTKYNINVRFNIITLSNSSEICAYICISITGQTLLNLAEFKKPEVVLNERAVWELKEPALMLS